MASLTGQTIATSYEQLLHVDTDGGGNGTTAVPVKDGDNDTTFALQVATDAITVDNPTTSSATQGGKLRLQCDDGAVMASTHRLGVIEFAGAEDTGSTITVGARIEAICDALWASDENGAELHFYTTDGDATQTAHMLLKPDGSLNLPTANCIISNSSGTLIASDANDQNIKLSVGGSGQMQLFAVNTGFAVSIHNDGGAGGSKGIQCKAGVDSGGDGGVNFQVATGNGTQVGLISWANTTTTYATSSDYRLKENVVPLSNALTRINQFKPYNFNFKDNPGLLMEGFLAHEVDEIIPYAVVGQKDAVNEDGSIDPQSMDSSHLIPLLVKSVQELSTKVTALEG
tara:strand:+ start:4080 stop:5108 length:1029 start_codon:yes stop_codon:yes gene_type:complete